MSDPTFRVLLIFALVEALFLLLLPHPPAPSRAMRASMIAAISGQLFVFLRKAAPSSSDANPEDIPKQEPAGVRSGLCERRPIHSARCPSSPPRGDVERRISTRCAPTPNGIPVAFTSRATRA